MESLLRAEEEETYSDRDSIHGKKIGQAKS